MNHAWYFYFGTAPKSLRPVRKRSGAPFTAMGLASGQQIKHAHGVLHAFSISDSKGAPDEIIYPFDGH
jgi:hypothetical protein